MMMYRQYITTGMNRNMEKIDSNALKALLEQEKKWTSKFSRETYAASFAEFQEENSELWNSFRVLFREETNDTEAENAVALALVERAKEIVAQPNKRSAREEKQLNMNLYLVSYILPAILDCQDSRKKDSNACKMAQAICDKWHEAFPKYAVQYADFASIQSGFKQKLCYITTAVCKGLHKPQNCKELCLMKQYRDEYLMQTDEGKEIVSKYYDIAPTIVKRMEKESTAEEKYRYLWEHYLKFCVALIEAGEMEACREKYNEMVEELKKQYVITKRKEDK